MNWEWLYDDEDDDDLRAEELLKASMHLLDEIKDQMASYPVARPILSNKQVMSFEDLIEDAFYEMHHRDGSCWTVQFKSLYIGARGWRISYVISGYTNASHVYLSDVGVIPYENGKWNPTNYMEIV